jgi:hypothetical protein
MARYKDAIEWMADNDDTEWANHDGSSAIGTESVTACLVADLFNKDIAQVREDLIRRLTRKTRPAESAARHQ